MVECGHHPNLCQVARSDGTPVSVSGSHRAFTEALSITGLKDVSTLSLHILKKNAPATVFNEIPAGCLASDTLVWLSTTADASGLIAFFPRIIARCSAAMLFSLSKQTIPATLLLAALRLGDFYLFLFRRRTRLMLILVTGNSRKTPSLSATFRFPSRKPASITNSRKS